jgi:hypothetical protein
VRRAVDNDLRLDRPVGDVVEPAVVVGIVDERPFAAAIVARDGGIELRFAAAADDEQMALGVGTQLAERIDGQRRAGDGEFLGRGVAAIDAARAAVELEPPAAFVGPRRARTRRCGTAPPAASPVRRRT